jgi:hypothetical protein
MEVVVVLFGGEPQPRFASREALDQLGEIAGDSFIATRTNLPGRALS